MIDKKEASSNLAVSEEANEPEQNKATNFIQQLKAEIHANSLNSNANDTIFPINGLPQVILDFALEVSEVYGVPIEFPVMSALCAVSAAARKKEVCHRQRQIQELWPIMGYAGCTSRSRKN